MRQRRLLQVSTFPFLAVLLCTMGSLLLLLLVIDRRAKAVARAKALQAAARAASTTEQLARANQAEWEARRAALHSRLFREDDTLRDRIRRVSLQEGEVGQRAQRRDAELRNLEEQLQRETARLKELKARVVTDADTEPDKNGRAREELVRLTPELAKLEQTLADVQAARRRQKDVYSLIPYKGKLGDNREPIYVECQQEAVILHPDHLQITADAGFGTAIRSAIEARIEIRKQTGAGVPYLFMLVRPDGIHTYYRTLAALQGLAVDFGYEFVEASWAFDFGESAASSAALGSAATNRRVTAQTKIAPGMAAGGVRGSGPAAVSSGSSSAGWAVAGTVPAEGGAIGPPTMGNSSGEPVRGKTDPLVGGGVAYQGGTGPAALLGPPRPALSGAAGLSSGQPRGNLGDTAQGPPRSGGSPSLTAAIEGAKLPSPVGQGPAETVNLMPTRTGVPVAATAAASPAQLPAAGMPSPSSAALTQAMGQGTVAQAGDGGGRVEARPDANHPPGMPSALAKASGREEAAGAGERGANTGTAQTGGATSRGEAQAQVASNPGTTSSGSPTSFGDPYTAGSARQQGRPDLAPRRSLGTRDWTITVECSGDGVRILPGGIRVALDGLSTSTSAENVLLQQIRGLIARRQAFSLPGEPPYRPSIRFAVQPDGLRAYYEAYPALEALRIPMSREDVRPEKKIAGDSLR
jgi:hypothetical protein